TRRSDLSGTNSRPFSCSSKNAFNHSSTWRWCCRSYERTVQFLYMLQSSCLYLDKL
ncbi:unnamed protein product, partial [Musa acuminata var. zebrina]